MESYTSRFAIDLLLAGEVKELTTSFSGDATILSVQVKKIKVDLTFM